MTYRLTETGPVWPVRDVFKLPDSAGWMVPSSRNHDGVGWWYHVTWTTEPKTGHILYHCTCRAGADRLTMSAWSDWPNPCRHVLAVTVAEAAAANSVSTPRVAGESGDLSRFT